MLVLASSPPPSTAFWSSSDLSALSYFVLLKNLIVCLGLGLVRELRQKTEVLQKKIAEEREWIRKRELEVQAAKDKLQKLAVMTA